MFSEIFGTVLGSREDSEPVTTAAKYGYELFDEMRYFDSHFVSFAHERK